MRRPRRTTDGRDAPVPSTVAEPANAFVGRAREFATATRLLDAGERSLTLTGAPGIGKSRLAARIANAHAARFLEGGVWSVALAEKRAEREVCEAVARAIGLSAGTNASPESIGETLRACGRTLVILDDAEGAVDALVALTTRWLGVAPALVLVTTSRELLRTPSEFAIELPPLSISDAQGVACESRALLKDRLQRLRHEPGALDDRDAVDRLLVAMEGIPLPIELIAARLATLPASTLLSRMNRRLEILSHGTRGESTRRTTLRGSLDASWPLLRRDEQRVFTQCSVFGGDFTLDDAEAVVEVGTSAAPTMDVLQSLRDKSLLRTTNTGARFAMFQSIRDYAREKLATEGLARVVEARCAEHFAARARDGVDRARSAGLAALRAWGTAEQGNLFSIVEQAVAKTRASSQTTDDGEVRDAIERAVTIALALEPSMLGRGPLDRLIEPLDVLCSDPCFERITPRTRAAALTLRGTGRRRRGRLEEARADFHAALAIAESVGAVDIVAGAQRGLGTLAYVQSDFVRARSLLEAARSQFESLGQVAELTATTSVLADVLREQGHDDDARRAHEFAIDSFHELGDPVGEAVAAGGLGALLVSRNATTEALACFERAAALLSSRDESSERAYALASIGFVYHTEGALELAAAAYEHALSMYRAVGDRRFEAMYAGHLGALRHEQGRLREALELLSTSARQLTALGDSQGAVFTAWRAGVAAHLGYQHEARDALARLGTPRPEHVVAIAAQAFARMFLDPADGAQRESAYAELVALGSTIEARVMRRVVDQFFPSVTAAPTTAPVPPKPTSKYAMTVHRNGEWFEIASVGRVSCVKRNVIRALLLRLVHERLEAPGHALGPAALLAAAWPGEKIMPGAAMNRLYVMITKLRKLGLRELLVSHDDGYLLDPSREIAVADDA